MRKTEVFNWQLAFELKRSLEAAAESEQISLAQLLEQIVSDWLARRSQPDSDDEETQRQLHKAAAQSFGTLHGNDPNRSQEVSKRIKSKLRERFEDQRTH